MFALAAGLISFGVLAMLGLKRGRAGVLALTLALNPVAGAQFATKMVDGAMASMLVVGVMLVVLMTWRGRADALTSSALFGSVVLMVNTKYTGVTYVAVILIPIAVIGARVAGRRGRELLQPAVALFGALLIGVLFVGWNPYVTNTIRHHNPLYIAVGKGSVDPAERLMVGRMKTASGPERILLSLASASSGAVRNPHVRLPLLASTSEWSVFRSRAAPIGGFGPLFSGGLLGALALVVVAAVTRVRGARLNLAGRLLMISSGALLVAWVISPAAWIARLAPQLWMVPVLALAGLLVGSRSRAIKGAALVVVAILAVNALGVAGSALVWSRRDTATQRTSLQRLRLLPGPLTGQFGGFSIAEERRLRDAGIKYRRVASVSCPHSFVLSISGVLTRPGASWPTRRSGPMGAAALCPAT